MEGGGPGDARCGHRPQCRTLSVSCPPGVTPKQGRSPPAGHRRWNVSSEDGGHTLTSHAGQARGQGSHRDELQPPPLWIRPSGTGQLVPGSPRCQGDAGQCSSAPGSSPHWRLSWRKADTHEDGVRPLSPAGDKQPRGGRAAGEGSWALRWPCLTATSGRSLSKRQQTGCLPPSLRHRASSPRSRARAFQHCPLNNWTPGALTEGTFAACSSKGRGPESR